MLNYLFPGLTPISQRTGGPIIENILECCFVVISQTTTWYRASSSPCVLSTSYPHVALWFLSPVYPPILILSILFNQFLWSPFPMANRLHFILSLATKKSSQILTSLKFDSSLKMSLPCGGFRVGYSGSQCPLWVPRWNGCSPGYSLLLTPPPSCKNFSFDIYANQLYFLTSASLFGQFLIHWKLPTFLSSWQLESCCSPGWLWCWCGGITSCPNLSIPQLHLFQGSHPFPWQPSMSWTYLKLPLALTS